MLNSMIWEVEDVPACSIIVGGLSEMSNGETVRRIESDRDSWPLVAVTVTV
jgi:hypothetical protein